MKLKYTGIESRLALNFFIMFLIDCLVGAFLPVILHERGFNSVEIGQLRAYGYAMVAFAPFLYALLTEKIGNRRRALQIGSFLSGITVIALLGDIGYIFFALLIVVQQFFQQGTATQLDAHTINTMEDQNRYGIVRIWGSIGFVVTVISGGFVSDHWGLEALIYYMCFIQVLLMFSVMMLPEDKGSITKSSSMRDKPKFKLERNYLLVLVVVFFCFVSQGVYNNFFMIYVKSMGLSETTGGTIMSIGTVSEMVMLIGSVVLLSRYKPSHLLAISCVVTALRWMMQGWAGDSVVILVVSQVGHAFTFALLHASVISFIQKSFNDKEIGRATGLYGSFGLGLGNIVGSLLSGYFWDSLGAEYAYSVCALMALCGALVALFIKTPTEKQDEAEVIHA
ncbi:putative Major facilitator superfamily permease [Vibrio harveyi]|uniref:MFS transporter n=1 Tax=Vibrio harveyi TaxID=669 RepID=UPI002ADB8E20|nr:MFS transporter [Vibrio harveyi]CAK6715218.1 putative Major facilitator superfamily permease [Vibrio harveyi]